MNEIPKILEPKEKFIFEGKPLATPYYFDLILKSIFLAAFLGICFGFVFRNLILGLVLGIAVLALSLILGLLAYSRVHYAITNKRVIIQAGIIGRDFKSIDFDRMQNVSVQVGPIGVLFKVGTILIFTGEMESTGGKHHQIKAKYDRFEYVANPYGVLKQLQTHLSKRKERLA